MKRIPVQVLLAILIACLATNTASSSALVDAPAPDFALRGIDGKTLRLSEYRSEIVLLSFASDSCARCRQALPFFEQLHRQYQSEGLNVIGVNVEGDSRAVTDLATELGLNFPFLLDTGQSVSRLYDLNQLPLTLLIDREGRVHLINTGFRGDSGAQISTEVARLLAD
ncbi:MAG: redoxin domain-containing protein [Gammaproteobacteria bacterium]|nr:redoxin domain-containing protein [Gammaproteobacteria bacterium]